MCRHFRICPPLYTMSKKCVAMDTAAVKNFFLNNFQRVFNCLLNRLIGFGYPRPRMQHVHWSSEYAFSQINIGHVLYNFSPLNSNFPRPGIPGRKMTR